VQRLYQRHDDNYWRNKSQYVKKERNLLILRSHIITHNKKSWLSQTVVLRKHIYPIFKIFKHSIYTSKNKKQNQKDKLSILV